MILDLPSTGSPPLCMGESELYNTTVSFVFAVFCGICPFCTFADFFKIALARAAGNEANPLNDTHPNCGSRFLLSTHEIDTI